MYKIMRERDLRLGGALLSMVHVTLAYSSMPLQSILAPETYGQSLREVSVPLHSTLSIPYTELTF